MPRMEDSAESVIAVAFLRVEGSAKRSTADLLLFIPTFLPRFLPFLMFKTRALSMTARFVMAIGSVGMVRSTSVTR